MTEEEKIHIAAEKLYEAYGADACRRVFCNLEWSDQPEGFGFWGAVYDVLSGWRSNGKPA